MTGGGRGRGRVRAGVGGGTRVEGGSPALDSVMAESEASHLRLREGFIGGGSALDLPAEIAPLAVGHHDAQRLTRHKVLVVPHNT